MEKDPKSGKRAGSGRGLPLLAAVATAAAAAAWVWPFGGSALSPLQPEASPRATASAAPASPVDARRSPLDAPAPLASDAGAAPVQVQAAELARARAPLQDSEARMGEREHYDRFLALGARDRAALEGEAGRVLNGAGPDCEKVALLRALRASASPQWDAWLEHAVVSLPDDSGAAADSVSAYALEQLIGVADGDLRARAALERIAFGPRRAPQRLRRVAASSLAASASESELWRLAQDLSSEEDALMRASVREALSRNRDPSAVAAVFGGAQDGEDPGSSESARD